MKWLLPVIGGVVSAHYGFGLDTLLFWGQAVFIGIIVGLLP